MLDQLQPGFHGKSRFTFPGIRKIQNLFPGIPGISAENFYFICIKISNNGILKKRQVLSIIIIIYLIGDLTGVAASK